MFLNVFGLELDLKGIFTILPVYLTKQQQERHVNLLTIHQSE